MLDEIKKDFKWGKKTSDRGYLNLDDEQVVWLIKQAEKVEMLEKRLQEIAITSYCIICGDTATEVIRGRFYCEDCGVNVEGD